LTSRQAVTLFTAGIVAAGGALGVIGCGGGGEAEHAEAAEVEAPSGQSPVPGTLAAAESSAEDLIGFALSGDRKSVIAEAARLKATANGSAMAALTQDGVRPATVAVLKRRANRVAQLAPAASFADIALAANAVSQLMPGLYGGFQNPVPTAILALDYLDREAQFRSLAHQPEMVASAVKELSHTWRRVRPRVVAAGGESEAVAYQAHVAAMQELSPAAAAKVQAEAAHGLELVDQLEHVFSR
jgi:hypothetical protein